jgi:aspartyl-tRNA(Asn)/glutamyl-tRNA(Gln) amidotransferase subunit A
MCRTVADAAMMFSQMTDHPVAKATSTDVDTMVRQFRIGVARNTTTLCEGPLDDEVRSLFEAACAVIRTLVADVRDVEAPFPVRFGALIDAEAYQHHAATLKRRSSDIDARTLALFMEGKAMRTSEISSLREEIRRYRSARHDIFSRVDLVVLPTLPTLPPRIRDATEPFSMQSCTFAFSLGGWPAISIPCGFSRSGLPVGMQIAGPALSEPRLLALAQAYEAETQWHRARPPL